MRWIGATHAANLAKGVPYVALPFTIHAEQDNIQNGGIDMQLRGAINIGGGIIAIVPGGQIPAAAILLTSIIVTEPDSTIRLPGRKAKNHAAFIQDTSNWLGSSGKK
jgi:hypothetical protein